MGASSVTGIPIDLLIIGFGSVCAAVGAWMISQLSDIRKDSEKRGRHIAVLRSMMFQVCKKLDIPYHTGEDD
jgi:hypothetical protein